MEAIGAGLAITGLELHDIRAFKRLVLDLGGDKGPRMLSVIVGRNGTCKSTLLRCIALGLCHEADAAALLAKPGGQLVAEGASEGRILLRVASPSGEPTGEIQLRVGNDGGRDVLLDHRATRTLSPILVCGYGAARGTTGSTPPWRGTYRVMDSVATLFDYRENLVDTELMLRRLEDKLGSDRYDRAMKGIKRALGLGPQDRLRPAKGVALPSPDGASATISHWRRGRTDTA